MIPPLMRGRPRRHSLGGGPKLGVGDPPKNGRNPENRPQNRDFGLKTEKKGAISLGSWRRPPKIKIAIAPPSPDPPEFHRPECRSGSWAYWQGPRLVPSWLFSFTERTLCNATTARLLGRGFGFQDRALEPARITIYVFLGPFSWTFQDRLKLPSIATIYVFLGPFSWTFQDRALSTDF